MSSPNPAAVTAEFASLLSSLWQDLNEPFVLWQLAALLVCLATAWLIQRVARKHIHSAGANVSAARRFGQTGLRRVLFPLSALALVYLARALMLPYHRVPLLDLAIPLLLSLALIRFGVFTLRQALGASGWLASFEKLFAVLTWSVVALHIVGWLPEVIDGLESVSFRLGSQKLTLWMLLQGVVTVLLSLLLALWIAGALERRLLAATTVDANLRAVMMRVTRTLLIVVAILVALPMVGINLTTLSVFGGALGVGLGFGLQKIAANYVSGFIILLDRSIRIGNLISVGKDRGVVKEITTRYTLVTAANGIESIIPNEVLVASVVQNETFSDTRVNVPLNFQIGYEADVESALQVLVEVARLQPRVLQEPPPKSFLASFGDNGINLTLLYWIADPQEGVLGINSAINLEVWRCFKAAGISIPFPQREVRVLAPAAAGEAAVKTELRQALAGVAAGT